MTVIEQLRTAAEPDSQVGLEDVGGEAAIYEIGSELASDQAVVGAARVLGRAWESLDDADIAAEVLEQAVTENRHLIVLQNLLDEIASSAALTAALSHRIEAPLLERLRDRSDEQRAFVAAAAFDGLARFTLAESIAHYALFDEITRIGAEEQAPFAKPAARLIGRLHDHWRDQALRDALERLVEVDAAASNAAFELGMCEFALALEQEDTDSVISGLGRSREWLGSAMRADEDRIDAKAFSAVIDGVVVFHHGGKTELLQDSYEQLRDSVEARRLWLFGMHDSWLSARPLAEPEWLELIAMVRDAAANLDRESWLSAEEVLPRVVRVYAATRTFKLWRDDERSSQGLAGIVQPRIEAAFIEHAGIRAHLTDWLAELGEDDELGEPAKALLEASESETPGKARRFRSRPGSPGSSP